MGIYWIKATVATCKQECLDLESRSSRMILNQSSTFHPPNRPRSSAEMSKLGSSGPAL